MYSCSINPLPASHNALMSRGVIYIMNSCVHAWCNIWGAHPAVSRAQSTDSLSVYPSFRLSTWLQSAYSATLLLLLLLLSSDTSEWEAQLPVFPQKNEQTSYWSSCWRGGFGFQSPALHNLFPQLGQIKKTKERSTGRGGGLGAEGIYIYIYVCIHKGKD